MSDLQLPPPGSRESLGTTFKRIVRSLLVPNDASNNQPAILIGADLPLCMQAAYSSAIFWRPPGSVTVNAPWYFMAQPRVTAIEFQKVDHGFLWYNGTDCGYVVVHRAQAFNTAGAFDTSERFGQIATSGASFNSLPIINFENARVEFVGASIRIYTGNTILIESPVDLDGATTVSAVDNTNFSNGSTTYVTTGGPLVEKVFVIPPNGLVMLHYGGFAANNVLGNANFYTIQIREGGTPGAGTIVEPASDNNSVEITNTAGNPDRQGVSFLFTAGVVGNFYNVQLFHRVTGGSGNYDRRYLIASPAF